MSPQLRSPSSPPESTSHSSSPSLPTTLYTNRYPLLITAYALLTSTLLYRISRSPLSSARKWEQYETIFKGTTLGAVVLGVALGGGWNRRRSEVVAMQRGDGPKGKDDEGSEREREEARRIVREGGVQRD